MAFENFGMADITALSEITGGEVDWHSGIADGIKALGVYGGAYAVAAACPPLALVGVAIGAYYTYNEWNELDTNNNIKKLIN